MKISQIINETSAGATGSGSVASVSSPLGATQSRNASIYGDKKVGNLFKGKKTNKPYANSINEGKEERERNAKLAQATDYEKRAKATKNDIKKAHYTKMADEIRRSIKTSDEQIAEAKLDEEDKIIAVGKGKKLKTGLHGKSEEPKLKGFKVPFKHQGVFVSDKRGNKVCECENEGIAQEVAKALTAYAIANEVKIQGAGAIAGGIANESELRDFDDLQAKRKALQDIQTDPDTAKDPALVSELVRRKAELERQAKQQGLGEGAKVDRMAKHIEKSERKLGKSKDEAENIAWATLNKRGYLDNKNKKKGK